MKLDKMELFYTPKDVQELQDWIEAHTKEDRAHLYTVMGMTWNLIAAALDEEEKLRQDVKMSDIKYPDNVMLELMQEHEDRHQENMKRILELEQRLIDAKAEADKWKKRAR